MHEYERAAFSRPPSMGSFKRNGSLLSSCGLRAMTKLDPSTLRFPLPTGRKASGSKASEPPSHLR